VNYSIVKRHDNPMLPNANEQCQMPIHNADFFSTIDKMIGNPYVIQFPRNM